MANAMNPGAATHGHSHAADRTHTTLGQKLAMAVGATFLLVGILGFVPGITSNFDELTFAGHHSDAQLLGIFNVSVLHNLVHVAFGIAGIVMARRHAAAVAYLGIGGAIYLVLAAYGAVIDHDSGANFVPINNADNWLHLGLGVGMLAGALASKRDDHADTTVDRTTRRV